MNYLFHSNYPYFDALHLGRFLRYLAQIEWVLLVGANPTQRLCHVAYYAGGVVFKNRLFDAGISSDEFARRQAGEARLQAMSEDERSREFEEIVQQLRDGDFDDDNASEEEWRSPVPDRARVGEFTRMARELLLPLAEFAIPGDSLIEDLAADYAKSGPNRTKLRAFYGVMTAWDSMRMHFEGRPPYAVSFAPTFAESLESLLEDEGDPAPDVAGFLGRFSGVPEYQMRLEDFAKARAGIGRAHRSQTLPERVIQRLLKQLNEWEAEDRQAIGGGDCG